jgi:hypothetical protein
MGHVAGTTFGIGTPTAFTGTPIPWGFAPYAGQSFGAQPFPQQPYLQPIANPSMAGFGIGAPQPLQQILQILQVVPQQLQQLQGIQQHLLVQIQHLSQLVPAQLQQLQQLIQVVPQQIQYLQQQQPFGASFSGPLGFGLAPQTLAGQAAGYVM